VLEPHQIDRQWWLTQTYPLCQYIVQYEETDFDFINHHLEHWGIFYFFKQEPEGEVLYLTDDPSSATFLQDYDTLSFNPSTGQSSVRGSVHDIQVAHRRQPAEVVLREYNYRATHITDPSYKGPAVIQKSDERAGYGVHFSFDVEPEIDVSRAVGKEPAVRPWPPPPAPDTFLVKNKTPFPHGTRLTSLEPPKPFMAVVVRGRFDLVPDGVATRPETPEGLDAIIQGPLCGDLYAEGDDECLGELLYPSDLADYKLRTDVIFKGSCHTPGEAELPRCPVSMEVGDWKKSLWVVDRRVWKEGFFGPKASDPIPFSEMPISYKRSFGGSRSPLNPVGMGARDDRASQHRKP
jgi:hypothetical protein